MPRKLVFYVVYDTANFIIINFIAEIIFYIANSKVQSVNRIHIAYHLSYSWYTLEHVNTRYFINQFVGFKSYTHNNPAKKSILTGFRICKIDAK